MNLYIRFFNDETLVSNIDEAIAFLSHVTNGQLDDIIFQQLTDYYNSANPYPRRFKVRSRIYFICIKTTAETMEQFKERGQQQQELQDVEESAAEEDATENVAPRPESNEEVRPKPSYDLPQPGWYEVEMMFKRVLFNEEKGKNEYVDTSFSARLKAHSIRECYTLVCQHLMNRDDIDKRSQMPSIKGRNFSCKFLGMKI